MIGIENSTKIFKKEKQSIFQKKSEKLSSNITNLHHLSIKNCNNYLASAQNAAKKPLKLKK